MNWESFVWGLAFGGMLCTMVHLVVDVVQINRRRARR